MSDPRNVPRTILLFSWFYLPYTGGAELFTKAIVDHLGERFRFVIVTARANRKLPRTESSEATVVRAGVGRPIDKFLYPLPALGRALAVRHVHLVHAVMVNPAALTAYLYLKMRRRPSLLTLQSGDSDEYVRQYLGPLFALYRRLHRPFDQIHAISEYLRERAVRFGADPERISVIPNGVDVRNFSREAWSQEELQELRHRLGLDDKRIVISVSRLALKNAIQDLVRAMPDVLTKHPDTVLLLVGDGEELGTLKRLCQDLGIRDRVVFAGTVPHRDTARYLLISDVFVRPSVSEGLGTAFLEALACETPIVGTPVGGICEFLREGETGIPCRPGDPKSVAQAIDTILSNPELARQMAENGRRLVCQSYRWEQVAERIGKLYESLLDER